MISDPFDVLLDQWEAQTRLLLDHGLDAQLQARSERLFAGRSGASPDATWTAECGDASPSAIDVLTLANVLSVTRQLARFRLTAGQHRAIDGLRAWLLAQLQDSRDMASRVGASTGVAEQRRARAPAEQDHDLPRQAAPGAHRAPVAGFDHQPRRATAH